MKKTKLFALALLALGVCMNLTACDDDDNGSGSGSLNPSASILATDSGDMLMTSNGEWYFEYDADGNCTRAYNNYQDYDLSKPNSVTATSYNESCKITLSFNSDGYISKYVNNYSSDNGHGSVNMTISYNSDNQISQLKYDYKDYTNDTWIESGNLYYEYSNGTLKSVTGECSEDYSYTSDGKKESYHSDYNGNVTFTSSNKNNKYQQITNSDETILDNCDDFTGLWYLKPFVYIGWCGKGSKKLFSDVDSYYYVAWDDGDSYKETRNQSASFTLNDDLTIETETMSYFNDRYEYSYEQLGSNTKSVENKSLVETSELEGQNSEARHKHHHLHLTE